MRQGNAASAPAGRTVAHRTGFRDVEPLREQHAKALSFFLNLGKAGAAIACALQLVACASTPGAAPPTAGRAGSSIVQVSFRDTARMSEQQRFDHYATTVRSAGGRVLTGPGERTILGVRSETSTKANGGNGVYDDKIVLLWQRADGTKRCSEYPGCTEPTAAFEGRYGVDVDGDGRRDLGRLTPGTRSFAVSQSDGLGNVLRPSSSATVERDVNHDGSFNERVTSSAGRSVLFHCGGDAMTSIAGCQTMPPQSWARFWSDLHDAGAPDAISYTLTR